MKLQNMLKKVKKDQFIIANTMFYKDNKPFAITESTPKDWKYKILTIDFCNNIFRSIDLDWLLVILIDFYGKDYLIDNIKKFKNYDEIKEIDIPLKSEQGDAENE